jgi:hypothetical protein
MAEATPQKPTPPEPGDGHFYNWVWFSKETLSFFRAAVRVYEEVLEKDIATVRDDSELSMLLDQEALESYPIGREYDRAKWVRQWLDGQIEQAGDSSMVHATISHGTVRFLKSVEIVFLQHLRHKRDSLAASPSTSKALLNALDQQLARVEEQAGQGIFQAATPYPLVIDQLPVATTVEDITAPIATFPEAPKRTRPVVLDTIEIRDAALRRRCLDLLAQFQQDGEHDRLDTVVSEATRILEARLRTLAGADVSGFGVDLATFAFKASPTPRLRVSEIPSEQEAAHLLYRGVFGFVRNSSHHRLLGELQPERVLQIVGMLDYLISVAEAAHRNVSSSE